MEMKSLFRWLIGSLLAKVGLTNCFRIFYRLYAEALIRALNPQVLKAAWIRRSVVNSDFIPLVSDLDLTILIDDKRFQELSKNSRFPYWPLAKDVQIISHRFADAWMETGGFRNYQFAGWKQIQGSPKNLKNPESKREERAFEVAFEIHLIYKQIATRKRNRRELLKLSRELKRIQLFWSTGQLSWVMEERQKIPFDGDEADTLILLDELCTEIIQELEPPLNVYDWRGTIISEDSIGYEININFKGQPIFVMKDPTKILEARKKRSHFYFVTPSYIQMIKGIGVQEQSGLNRLAKEHPYYRRFSCQRLAHDLLGASILEPDNSEQLFFCFYNISFFIFEITGEFPQIWPAIEISWKDNRMNSIKGKELERLIIANLDLLASFLYD
jgi:hypothetical protein